MVAVLCNQLLKVESWKELVRMDGNLGMWVLYSDIFVACSTCTDNKKQRFWAFPTSQIFDASEEEQMSRTQTKNLNKQQCYDMFGWRVIKWGLWFSLWHISVRATSCWHSWDFTEVKSERLELKGRDWPCTSFGHAQWNGCNTAEPWGWCFHWCPAGWAATHPASGNIYRETKRQRGIFHLRLLLKKILFFSPKNCTLLLYLQKL